MIPNLIFLDTETTDLEKARLIQLAFKNKATDETFMQYFKPPIAIDFAAMATHHITEKMVADKLPFNESEIYKTLPSLLKDSVLVAHNAKFDIGVLKNEGIEIETGQYICTYKVASMLYDYPQHKMQYLRYRWNIEIENATAHDALGDVLILEKVFEYMVAEYSKEKQILQEETIKFFIELTAKPILLKRLTFGKHAGKTFEEIKSNDSSYLNWLLTLKDKDEDFYYTINHHLSK